MRVNMLVSASLYGFSNDITYKRLTYLLGLCVICTIYFYCWEHNYTNIY